MWQQWWSLVFFFFFFWSTTADLTCQMVGTPPVKLIGRGPAGGKPTLHGVWTQDLYWVPGFQNGLYQWAITPRQWSLFWVYMCMVIGGPTYCILSPLSISFLLGICDSNGILGSGGLPNPLYDPENSLPQQHLLTPPRKWKKGWW